MRDHYDFSMMKGRKNPYVKNLKQPVTMRLDCDTVTYFKSIAEEMGVVVHGRLDKFSLKMLITLEARIGHGYA
jgi:hypothetical protein